MTISNEICSQLKEKYGTPVSFDTNQKPRKFNQRFFAALFRELNPVSYDPVEKTFFRYSSETGLFKPVSQEKLCDLLGEAFHDYGKEFGLEDFDMLTTASAISAVYRILKGMTEERMDSESADKLSIQCQNTVLEQDPVSKRFVQKPFHPKYLNRYALPVRYDPEAKCPEFLERLLAPAMTPDDVDLLQLYSGQCLLGKNYSQTFLLITGTAAGGKSTVSKIIETMIGREKCVGLRIEKLNGNFEIGRCRGKTLLTGKDVDSGVLSCAGARNLKALTGGDPQSGELKNSNEIVDIHGMFNIIIVSNAFLRVEFDSDIEAWRRRLLWINYEKPPVPEEKRITDFDRILIQKEGSGILNWMLEGAEKLLLNGRKIRKSPEQTARVDFLLKSSDGVKFFVQNYVRPKADSNITTEEAVFACNRFFDHMNWPRFPERIIQQRFNAAMREIHHQMNNTPIQRKNGDRLRGYRNFQICKFTEIQNKK